MKPKTRLAIHFLPVLLAGATHAEVFYSNLRDIAIPTDHTGIYLNILNGATGTNDDSPPAGWHINPFNGGINVWTSPDFQPLRETNADDGTLSNISIGALVGSASSFFVSGFGASGNHLGNTFMPGQEGYIGFSVNNSSTTNYGWMRVVFNGTGNALIRDWAYDTSGGAINVARIQQSAAVDNAQWVTLSPGAGESFTLGSAITNTGGNINSVVMNGLGAVSLTEVNTHTGTTTIQSGSLSVDGTGSINQSNLTLDGGTFRYNSSVDYTGTFTYTSGTIGGTNLNGSLDNLVIGPGQVLSPGNSVGATYTGSQTWAGGGTYQWEINDATGAAGGTNGWDVLIGTGTLAITATDTPFTILIESLGIIGGEIEASNFDEMSTYTWLIADFDSITGFSESAFLLDTTGFENAFSGTFGLALGDTVQGGDSGQLYLTYTAIPEPRVALLAALGFVLLLRRSARPSNTQNQRQTH